MLKSILTALSLALLLSAAPASAATVIEDGSWPYGKDAVKALEIAKEKNRPIVLLLSARKTTCPKCIGGSQATIRAKEHKGMVRAIYYYGDAKQPESPLNEPELRDLVKQIYKKTGNMLDFSETAYFTPDGQLIAYVPYSERKDLAAEAKTVMQIHAWMTDVAKETEKADDLAERGRYAPALDKLAKVKEQDAKISHLIQQLLGKAKKDDKMPDEPVSPFYAELYDTKHAEYQAAAAAKLAEVQALFDKDKFRDAQRAIRVVKQTPDSFGVTDQVKQLNDKINAALRS